MATKESDCPLRGFVAALQKMVARRIWARALGFGAEVLIMAREDDLELVEGDVEDDEFDEDEELGEVGTLAGARGFAAGLVLGALVGAGLALIIAPQRGEDLRRRVKRGLRDIHEDAREQLDDWRGQARRQLRSQRRRLRRRRRTGRRA